MTSSKPSLLKSKKPQPNLDWGKMSYIPLMAFPKTSGSIPLPLIQNQLICSDRNSRTAHLSAQGYFVLKDTFSGAVCSTLIRMTSPSISTLGILRFSPYRKWLLMRDEQIMTPLLLRVNPNKR